MDDLVGRVGGLDEAQGAHMCGRVTYGNASKIRVAVLKITAILGLFITGASSCSSGIQPAGLQRTGAQLSADLDVVSGGWRAEGPHEFGAESLSPQLQGWCDHVCFPGTVAGRFQVVEFRPAKPRGARGPELRQKISKRRVPLADAMLTPGLAICRRAAGRKTLRFPARASGLAHFIFSPVAARDPARLPLRHSNGRRTRSGWWLPRWA